VKRVVRPVFFVALASCGGGGAASFGPAKVDIPVTDGLAKPSKEALRPAVREMPPPSGAAKEASFPAVAHAKLANGMTLDVVTSRTLPVVQIRVLVRAGTGDAPAAVADLTASMLKDGGTRALSSAELLRRVETLGTSLSIHTDFDATVVSAAVTRDQLGEALSLLSQVVREPRFDEAELRKTKARAADEAADAARSSGQFMATRILFRELFPPPNPYATYGAVPSEIAKVDGAAIRDFHRRAFVPKATTLVLAGDVDEATAKQLADRHFGSWAGGEPPKVEHAPPRAPEALRVVVAHRPKSVQSDVFVAMLAPERRSPEWARVRVANQVLGGGVASRLFADVREQRSLAYRTSAQVMELAHGAQPLVLYAGTETSKTAQAVSGLLENVAKMAGAAPPTEQETKSARRFISDIFAIRMETIGSIADLVVTQETFGLPDGYWDAYRKEVRATDAAAAAAMAKKMYLADKSLVVVAGDADAVGQSLARFGEVTIVDPEKEFKMLRTIPHERGEK
jgi:zinc protease